LKTFLFQSAFYGYCTFNLCLLLFKMTLPLREIFIWRPVARSQLLAHLRRDCRTAWSLLLDVFLARGFAVAEAVRGMANSQHMRRIVLRSGFPPRSALPSRRGEAL
jgi:hypothetical protein